MGFCLEAFGQVNLLYTSLNIKGSFPQIDFSILSNG